MTDKIQPGDHLDSLERAVICEIPVYILDTNGFRSPILPEELRELSEDGYSDIKQYHELQSQLEKLSNAIIEIEESKVVQLKFEFNGYHYRANARIMQEEGKSYVWIGVPSTGDFEEKSEYVSNGTQPQGCLSVFFGRSKFAYKTDLIGFMVIVEDNQAKLYALEIRRDEIGEVIKNEVPLFYNREERESEFLGPILTRDIPILVKILSELNKSLLSDDTNTRT